MSGTSARGQLSTTQWIIGCFLGGPVLIALLAMLVQGITATPTPIVTTSPSGSSASAVMQPGGVVPKTPPTASPAKAKPTPCPTGDLDPMHPYWASWTAKGNQLHVKLPTGFPKVVSNATDKSLFGGRLDGSPVMTPSTDNPGYTDVTFHLLPGFAGAAIVWYRDTDGTCAVTPSYETVNGGTITVPTPVQSELILGTFIIARRYATGE